MKFLNICTSQTHVITFAGAKPNQTKKSANKKLKSELKIYLYHIRIRGRRIGLEHMNTREDDFDSEVYSSNLIGKL